MKLRTQLLPIALCVLIGSFATAPVDASCLAGACVLAGEDNFDGTSVYTSKWEFMIGDGCSYNLCGWGNKNKVFAPGQVLMPVRYRGEFMPPPDYCLQKRRHRLIGMHWIALRRGQRSHGVDRDSAVC